jgi:uncharacterized membrane protein YeaQ/YmgE (transglycosylase-associated protein family)
MNFIISILVGALAGWTADKIFDRFSFSIWLQVGLGILGGFVGGLILDDDLQQVLGFSAFIARILTALIGAVVILFVAGLIKGNKS